MNPTKTQWALKVRVVHLYEVPAYGTVDVSFSLEFVCHNKEGERIHASIKQSLINTFKPLLKEGAVYLIRHFIVGVNNLKYKTTGHKYKINFMTKTHIYESGDDRWYLSCKRCPKKVQCVGKRFYSEKCDRHESSGNPRFKIQVTMIDSTGTVYFLMWDRECTQLLGKTCAIVRDGIDSKKKGLDIPTEVESLVDRKILFKVQVKMENLDGHNDVFTVMRLTDDNNIISKYIDSNVENQESDLLSKIEKNDDEGNKISSSNDKVTTPSKTRINSVI
ncbi:Nucleic acid-binding [Abeliophyllum distichum]|uniref:Nucleic acid-binding n=1 Tax=Abeliophyllum distichum TaxID=126358 RepID=A0ABD1NYU1_9LAMI